MLSFGACRAHDGSSTQMEKKDDCDGCPRRDVSSTVLRTPDLSRSSSQHHSRSDLQSSSCRRTISLPVNLSSIETHHDLICAHRVECSRTRRPFDSLCSWGNHRNGQRLVRMGHMHRARIVVQVLLSKRRTVRILCAAGLLLLLTAFALRLSTKRSPSMPRVTPVGTLLFSTLSGSGGLMPRGSTNIAAVSADGFDSPTVAMAEAQPKQSYMDARMNVCIISRAAIWPPSKQPLEDAAATALGLAWIAHDLGHQITFLQLYPPSTTAQAATIQHILPPGANFETLSPSSPTMTPSLNSSRTASYSHQILQWLRMKDAKLRGVSHKAGVIRPRAHNTRCGVAHFVDATAEALYALLAQAQGLELQRTHLALHIVAPLEWILRRDSTALASVEVCEWSAHNQTLAISSAMDLPCLA